MKIATFINENGEVVSFHEKGSVCLFENFSGFWTNKKEISLEINRDMGLSELRGRFKYLVCQLEDCKVFLIGESKGALHVFLEALGFRTWKSEGSLIEQLDNVAKKDTETTLANEQSLNRVREFQNSLSSGAGCCRFPENALETQGRESAGILRTIPKPLSVGDIGDGYYRINLADVLSRDPSLNSKQVLIPFLEETTFQKLEILCDHLPKWFSKAVWQLDLRMESEVLDASGHGMKVMIFPKNQSEQGIKRENR